MTYYLIYLSISFFLTYSAVYPIKKIAKNYNIVSRKDHIRSREIPYFGGVAVYLGFILTLILFFYIEFPDQEIRISLGNPKFLGLLLGAILVTFSGLIHDVYPYSILLRIVIQILAACTLIVNNISFDHDFLRFLPINLGEGTFYLGNIFLSICWVVLVINCLDILDQIDGLFTNLLIVLSAIFFLFSVVNDQYENALVLATAMGGLLGVFVDQIKPSKILLGKSGTYFLGFLIAATSMDIKYTSSNLGFFIPIIILIVPIIYFVFTPFVHKKSTILHLRNKDINDEKQIFYVLVITCILSILLFVVSQQVG
ncbi:MraY family glycosyltransferase [Candidatus Uabimicrobium sp. HlEnr_7]|uniref:MraY family glycosyltransferase n=1 Tax=Candidatus Uabimicrobium helgolandensis TaxID=3095367 RepID=UPI003555C013